MGNHNKTVLTLSIDKKLKTSLQKYAVTASLLERKRGASGVILTLLSKFTKGDGTLDVDKLDDFLEEKPPQKQ